jgi:anti-sigma regulatory factor (Ser/Thr protein kinase)
MTQLHFEPIQGKTLGIIDTIIRTEEVVSLNDNMWRIIRMVVEELVVNIVDYSGSNYMNVEISCEKDRFTMCYRDGGVPFNPLEKEPPNFSIPIGQRQVGGLGIYLALTSMDTAEYEFVNGENVFTTSLFYKK